jgi:hypothetical protein
VDRGVPPHPRFTPYDPQPMDSGNGSLNAFQRQPWDGAGGMRGNAQPPSQPEQQHGSSAGRHHTEPIPQFMRMTRNMRADGGGDRTHQALVDLGQQLGQLRSPVKPKPKQSTQEVCNLNVLVHILTVACNVLLQSWCWP